MKKVLLNNWTKLKRCIYRKSSQLVIVKGSMLTIVKTYVLGFEVNENYKFNNVELTIYNN